MRLYFDEGRLILSPVQLTHIPELRLREAGTLYDELREEDYRRARNFSRLFRGDSLDIVFLGPQGDLSAEYRRGYIGFGINGFIVDDFIGGDTPVRCNNFDMKEMFNCGHYAWNVEARSVLGPDGLEYNRVRYKNSQVKVDRPTRISGTPFTVDYGEEVHNAVLLPDRIYTIRKVNMEPFEVEEL